MKNAITPLEAVEETIEAMRSLLAEAERFISGFEGDEMQDESVDDLLVRMRIYTDPEGSERDQAHAEQLASRA